MLSEKPLFTNEFGRVVYVFMRLPMSVRQRTHRRGRRRRNPGTGHLRQSIDERRGERGRVTCRACGRHSADADAGGCCRSRRAAGRRARRDWRTAPHVAEAQVGAIDARCGARAPHSCRANS